MPPRRDPVPRATGALHWLRGFLVLGIVAAAVVAAAVMLWQNLDVQRLTRSAALAEPVTILSMDGRFIMDEQLTVRSDGTILILVPAPTDQEPNP